MAGVAWVFVGAAAVATLVALLVFLVPLGRRGGESLSASQSLELGPAGPAGPDSPAGSLARGFSYLHISPPRGVRRAGVHDRLSRAFVRIDAVDPHEAPRRIGEALLHAGLADASVPAAGATPVPATPVPAGPVPAGPVPPGPVRSEPGPAVPAPAAPATADPHRSRPGRGPVEHPREPA